MASANRSAEGESFGAALRRYRVAAAMSQEALAERAGISVRAISDLERGVRRRPYLATVSLLADGLGLDPAQRVALAVAARPLARADHTPADAAEGRSRADVPIPPNSLIGREADVAAVRARLLDPDVRLVTLTGPGGVGKTRLAQAVARTLDGAFADGVRFVPLAAVTDPGAVALVVGQALAVPEIGTESPEERLRAFLGGKHLLLVLDNFEQIVEAGAMVADLLSGGSESKVMMTSRAPLRVAGEHEIAVSPLALPRAEEDAGHDATAPAPAVRLFVERARAVKSDFTLTPRNAAAVSAICRRLDGLPLAIELAAARTKILPPAALLARLERPLPLLTGGGRDLPERQRTIRNTIAWSYDLLTAKDQTLFRRLAVFAGGFTLETAEAVAVAGGADPDGTLDGIASLADSSLLQMAPDGESEPRYLMLETIREFGQEQLARHGDEHQWRRAHAAAFLALVEAETASEPLPEGHFLEAATLRRLDTEADNLRAALAWLLENDPSACVRLAAACAPYWLNRRHLHEARTQLERALAATASETTTARGRALLWIIDFLIPLGRIGDAEAHVGEARAMWDILGDVRGRAHALTHSGWVAEMSLKFDDALRFFDQALSLWQEMGASSLIADIYQMRSGIQYWHNGDLDAAEADISAAAVLFRELGKDFWVAHCDWYRAIFATARGRFDEAARRYRAALDSGIKHDIMLAVWKPTLGLAATAVEIGEAETAARLFGAAEAIRARTGEFIFPADKPAYERVTSGAREALGEVGFSTARAAGSSLTIPEILVVADGVVAAAIAAIPKYDKPDDVSAT